MIDVLGPEKRRRRGVQEKIAIVHQSFEPGMTVSLVARLHGVAASQLFLWRKQCQEGCLTGIAAGEQVVPALELASAMKQIKKLQRLLGKQSMENDLLKEAVEGALTASSSTVIMAKNCVSRSRWTAAIAKHCTGQTVPVDMAAKPCRTSCRERWSDASAVTCRHPPLSG